MDSEVAAASEASGYQVIDSNDPDGPEFRYIEIGEPAIPDEAYRYTHMYAPPSVVTEPTKALTRETLNRAENDIANETGEHPLRILLEGEDVSWPVSIGFQFEFYGQSYDHVLMSSNGFATFTDDRPHQLASGPFGGYEIPDERVPNNFIAAYWTALLDPGHGRWSPGVDAVADPGDGRGWIFARSVGEPGNRVFVVEFREVAHWYDGEQASFQIHLYESDNSIEVHYLDVDPALDPDTGVGWPRSAGIENADGTVGLQYVHDQLFGPEHLVVRYFLAE